MARRSRTQSRRRGSNTNRNAFFTEGSLVHVDQTTQTRPDRCNPNAIGGQLKISRNFFSTPKGLLVVLTQGSGNRQKPAAYLFIGLIWPRRQPFSIFALTVAKHAR